jgi:hypothetical protein
MSGLEGLTRSLCWLADRITHKGIRLPMRFSDYVADEKRALVLRHQIASLVEDFKDDNRENAFVQAAPIVRLTAAQSREGLAIGAIRVQPLNTRLLHASDFVIGTVILGHVLVYSGREYFAAIVTPEMSQPVYGEHYSICANAIDAMSPQVPKILRKMR